MYCKNFQGIVRTDEIAPYKLTLARVRCKQWSCLYCAQKNAQMWRVALTRQMIDKFPNEKWSFFTITVHLKEHKNLSEEERSRKSARVFRDNADALMKRLKRQHGNFAYVRVLEEHKQGGLHAHFVASFHFDDLKKEKRKDKYVTISKSLKKHAIDCGFGYITHAENLIDKENNEQWASKRVVGYVTKYVTKDSEHFTDFRSGLNIRKIQTSRQFISPFNPKYKEQDITWHIGFPIHVSLAEELDFSIYDLNRKKQLEPNDFAGNGHYPSKED